MARHNRLDDFRHARDTIENVRQIATEIDGSLGRFQIYDDREAISAAFGKVETLLQQARLLQVCLGSCRDQSGTQP